MRRRRVRAMGVALAVGMTTVGCLEPGPPPPGPVYDPPVITAVEVSPSPVVVGRPLTVTIRAVHPLGLRAGGVNFSNAQGTDLPGHHECGGAEAGAATGGDPEGVVAITCTLPPNVGNGGWTASVSVTANDGQWANTTKKFDVIGGGGDDDDPVVTDVQAPPSRLAKGQTFTFVVRAVDQSLPITSAPAMFTLQGQPLGPGDGFECAAPTITPESATSVLIAAQCTVPARATSGTYWGAVHAHDDLGNWDGHGWMVGVS